MRTAGTAISLILLGACASSPDGQPDDTNAAGDSPTTTGTPRDASGTARRTERSTAQEPGAPGGDLTQDGELIALREQKNKLLFDSAMAEARSLFDSMRFEAAQQQVGRALELNATSVEARRLLGDIQNALGIDAGAINAVQLDSAEEVALRYEQAKLEVKSSLTDGKLALARGDYDRAIGELSIAKTKIAMTPYNMQWDGMDLEVTRLLDQAVEERRASQEAARMSERDAAFREAKALETQQRDRDRAVVDNIVAQASLAFEAGRYDKAKALADKALALNSRHEQAQDLRDAAHRAGREKVQSDYIQAKREEFRNWRESIDQLRIPNTEIITLPDAEEWQEKGKKRQARRGLDLSKKVSAAEVELRAKLRTTTVTMPGIDGEESLENLIRIIRGNTGLLFSLLL
jgi:tetratricopeptide (TPR) repeat protein